MSRKALAKSMRDFLDMDRIRQGEGNNHIIDETVESFSLEFPGKSSVPNNDDGSILLKAEELLNSQWHFLPPEYDTHITVRNLGFDVAANKYNDIRNERKFWSAIRFARSLLGAEAPICLRLAQYCENTGQLGYEFSISAKGLAEDDIAALVRASYGQASFANTNHKMSLPFTYYAKGHDIVRDKKRYINIQTEANRIYDCDWITPLVKALLVESDFFAEIHFTPLENTMISTHIQKLESTYNQLKFLSSQNFGRGISANSSLSKIRDFVDTQKNAIFGGNQFVPSHGASLTLSAPNVNVRACHILDALAFELYRLKTACDSTLWAIGIMISASDQNTANVVASVLSGYFTGHNKILTWEKQPGTSFLDSPKEAERYAVPPMDDFPGFSYIPNERFLLNYSRASIGVTMGDVLWNGTPIDKYVLPLGALNRHAFLCGMTGSGKTNTLFQILVGTSLPFFVIEPVKGEYRALKNKFDSVNIWSMKASERSKSVNIFRFNPFWFPQNGDLASHLDSLKTIISSAFELSAAMPNILEQCLYNVYVRAGWNIATSQNIYDELLPETYRYPTFSDLCAEIEDYLDKSEFDSEVLSNYKGALLSRIQSFVNGTKGVLLNTSEHPDYEVFMNGRNVVELDGLADDADKCLVMGVILVQYYQHLKYSTHDNSTSLKHLIIIEEAHRLFKRVSTERVISSDGSIASNATGHLVDMLGNIMAEVRAFGEGLLIVDQSPSKVADDVIKNSATKIVHRIDNVNDIRLLQSALLLNESEASLPLLRQGEALIRTDGMARPCKVRINLSDEKESYCLSTTFSNRGSVKEELRDAFAATSILYDESAYSAISDLTKRFVLSLMLSDLVDWKSMVEKLLQEVIAILLPRDSLRIIGSRFDGLRELLSEVCRRTYGAERKSISGSIHMVLLRLIDTYRDESDGFPCKAAEIRLIENFIKRRITTPVVMKYDLEHNRLLYYDFCERTNLNPDNPWSMAIHQYIFSTAEEDCLSNKNLSADYDGVTLYNRFISTQTMLLPDNFRKIYEQTFTNVAKYLRLQVE